MTDMIIFNWKSFLGRLFWPASAVGFLWFKRKTTVAIFIVCTLLYIIYENI
jgi:hypothetical protein